MGNRHRGASGRCCQRGRAGVLGSGETSAHFHQSQGNLRQGFKEGKNLHNPSSSPLEYWPELSED